MKLLSSGCTTADTSVSLVRWQQGEQTAAGVGVKYKIMIESLSPATSTLANGGLRMSSGVLQPGE